MSCCNGTGWTVFRGDFETRDRAKVLKDVRQTVRCKEYKAYFNESQLMRDFPETVPVGRDDSCPAALSAHKLIREADQRKQKARKDRY